ncbi:hypothetical protein [Amycolatopsis thermoflava]|uniref:hypothetical protein n=1 Tax=Amycolatopsis thermoflava TaxID=84480 RepID=UPI0004163323|nr:hypothetical protein [Amycolatopsis thermoflava]
MKRGKPLARKTPLRTNAPLKSKRIAIGKTSVAHKPMKPYRPPAKSEAEIDARAKVAARSGGMCEAAIPGACQGQGREFQHRQAKGQQGAWSASNGLWVCGHGNTDGCHGYIHRHPIEAHLNGWSVQSWGDPLIRPVLRRGVRVLLDDEGGFQPARAGTG